MEIIHEGNGKKVTNIKCTIQKQQNLYLEQIAKVLKLMHKIRMSLTEIIGDTSQKEKLYMKMN